MTPRVFRPCAHKGRNIDSPTHRSPLPLRGDSSYSFQLKTPGPLALGRMKNLKDRIRNRTLEGKEAVAAEFEVIPRNWHSGGKRCLAYVPMAATVTVSAKFSIVTYTKFLLWVLPFYCGSFYDHPVTGHEGTGGEWRYGSAHS
jgi:hypothetical protein